MRGAITQPSQTNYQHNENGNQANVLDCGNEKYDCGDAQQDRPKQASTQARKIKLQQIDAKAGTSGD
jgi:hypothetical protein